MRLRRYKIKRTEYLDSGDNAFDVNFYQEALVLFFSSGLRLPLYNSWDMNSDNFKYIGTIYGYDERTDTFMVETNNKLNTKNLSIGLSIDSRAAEKDDNGRYMIDFKKYSKTSLRNILICANIVNDLDLITRRKVLARVLKYYTPGCISIGHFKDILNILRTKFRNYGIDDEKYKFSNYDFLSRTSICNMIKYYGGDIFRFGDTDHTEENIYYNENKLNEYIEKYELDKTVERIIKEVVNYSD